VVPKLFLYKIVSTKLWVYIMMQHAGLIIVP